LVPRNLGFTGEYSSFGAFALASVSVARFLLSWPLAWAMRDFS